MIRGVGSVAILVSDAKKSAEWYRDKLDFELVGIEGHGVFVRPAGAQEPLLHLCGRCDDWGSETPGGRTGVWLRCGEVTIRRDGKTGRVLPSSDPAEVEKTYLALKNKGVEFTEELKTLAWGKMAVFRDPDGNEFEIS